MILTFVLIPVELGIGVIFTLLNGVSTLLYFSQDSNCLYSTREFFAPRIFETIPWLMG